jgi:predicted nucleic acid-binding protein
MLQLLTHLKKHKRKLELQLVAVVNQGVLLQIEEVQQEEPQAAALI